MSSSANNSDRTATVSVSSPSHTTVQRGPRFWLILLALGCALSLVSVELTATSTALPAILEDLNGGDFIWISSSYTLASTAILPLSGGISEIFGRRPAILSALVLFSLGSVLCATAKQLAWLIGGRAVQGLGGGMVLSVTNIIIGDLVTLQQRGFVSGVLGLSWALSAAFGPLIGGALADSGQWRWIFYLNLPISALTLVLVLILLDLPTPSGTINEKLAKMDWIGNILVVASTTAIVIALTWGGVVFPWSNFRVLVPLILGGVGMLAFLAYEARIAKHPIVPFEILSNRTSISGYLQTLLSPIVLLAAIYYLPTYYQACKGASPYQSGIDSFGLTMTLGPASIVTGVSITKTGKYRYQCYLGWVLLVVATAALTTLHEDTPLSRAIGLPSLISIGAGMIYSAGYFPVLAPLSVSRNAHALAFFAFCRSFAGIWGITVGGTVLQNELSKRLPAEFIASLPNGQGVTIAYAAIPRIEFLEEPLRTQVRVAFAESIRVIWLVLIAVAATGLLCALLMRNVPMQSKMDEKWAVSAGKSGEKGVKVSPVTDEAAP
ncbi:MFS general substrate transporter [Mycena rebaudengoi]|nr:MFS general substrate transporter [Mycena rebaudengoi]